MKRTTQVPNFEQLKKEIYLEAEKQLDPIIDNAYNNLSVHDKKYLEVNFRILLMILGLFLLFIPWIFLYLGINRVKQQMMAGISMNKVYKAGFEKLKEVEFINAKQIKSRKDLYTNRVPWIPFDATIDRASAVLTMKINDKYEAVARIGRATWVRSDGKSTQRYYKNTGYVQIKATGVMPGFNYSLNHRNKMGGKKHDLESSIFNKAFEFKSNDGIKARMIYTPHSMEETVKYKSTNKLRYWNVEKNNEDILIRFLPHSWQDLNVDISASDFGSLKNIKDAIYKDISDDITNLYNIIFAVLIPPML